MIYHELKEIYKDTIVQDSEFLGLETFEVTNESYFSVLSFLKNQTSFEILVDLSGIDYLSPAEGTLVFALLRQPVNFTQICVTTFVKRGSQLPSMVSLWKGAEWYERELFDMFGVSIEGIKERILMPDDWEGHPLRKDYPKQPNLGL